MRKGQRFQYKVHKPGKRDNKSRKADNLIREISQQNQYNKQQLTNSNKSRLKRSQHYTGEDNGKCCNVAMLQCCIKHLPMCERA